MEPKHLNIEKLDLEKNVDSIVIYATSPIMKIIGEVQLIDILEGFPDIIWKKTFRSGGINKTSYDDYFEGKEKAIACRLGTVEKYENEMNLSDFHVNVPPQSYIYLD